jgi:hypothetical protein
VNKSRLFLFAFIGLVAFCVIDLAFLRGTFLWVPGAHDSRLVGSWKDVGHVRPGGSDFYVWTVQLNPDGTGFSPRHGRFWWGTSEGVIYVKYMATDAWVKIHAKYLFEAKGSRVSFAKFFLGPIPIHIARISSSSD